MRLEWLDGNGSVFAKAKVQIAGGQSVCCPAPEICWTNRTNSPRGSSNRMEFWGGQWKSYKREWMNVIAFDLSHSQRQQSGKPFIWWFPLRPGKNITNSDKLLHRWLLMKTNLLSLARMGALCRWIPHTLSSAPNPKTFLWLNTKKGKWNLESWNYLWRNACEGEKTFGIALFGFAANLFENKGKSFTFCGWIIHLLVHLDAC